MSYKEYLTRVRWHELEWNRPGRLEYYIMRLTQVVLQLFAKHPNEIKLNEQKIDFDVGDKPKKTEVTRGMLASLAGMLSGAVNRTKNMATARRRKK